MTNLIDRPYIVADFTRNRIRITRQTLRSLGQPDFIRLLINPENRTLAIEVCDHNEPRGHRVPDYIINSSNCYEITSKPLLEKLLYHTKWDPRGKYKMFATALADKQLILFNFDEAYRTAGGLLIEEAVGVTTHANEISADP